MSTGTPTAKSPNPTHRRLPRSPFPLGQSHLYLHSVTPTRPMKPSLLTLATTLALALAPTLLTHAGVLLSDDFPYPDGPITAASGGKWTNHSGTAEQANVVSGALTLTQSESEDINAPLTGAPFTGGVLYAGFTLTFNELPSGAGAYFAHFRDTGTGFRGRLFALTNDATPGAFRLAISSATTTLAPIPQDLALGTPFRVVMKLDVPTAVATLWLNPAAETDPSIVSTDTGSKVDISTFAFRQASGIGALSVDDLLVATEFAEVLGTPPATLPTITQQPQNQTVLEGASASFSVSAYGSSPLSYQWRKDGNDLAGATSPTYLIPATTPGDAGSYDVVITNPLGSTASNPATLTVETVATPPAITAPPSPTTQTVNPGATVTYTVTATGTPPLAFQWFHNNNEITGQTSSTLTLPNVTPANAGTYRVTVSNSAGTATSADVTLNVELPPPATIASLRATLDPINLTPTDTTTLFTVEGTVTTHVNLTGPSANVLFYFQDATAGIAVFWSGGTNAFLPKAGDRVRVTAPLTHFNGLLELAPSFSNPSHSVTLLASNQPLPTPLPLDFNYQLDPATMELYEGSYVVVSNVLVDLSTGPTFISGRTNGLSDELGQTFAMFADARTDIGGQAKPATPVTILGVLGQFDNSNPRDSAYQIIPTRFADILSASKAPTVRFTNVLQLIRKGDLPTNSYPELVLQPGETLTLHAHITDPEGRTINLSAPTAGLPASAQWTLSAPTGTELTATFTYQASQNEAGQLLTPTLVAANAVATYEATWKVYVPTPEEQKVTITEFLANPSSTPTAPHFNPLQRSLPTPLPSDYSDEYVEIVNLSPTDLDLAGWTISDSAALRHKFYESFILAAQSSMIAYGGPLNGLEPSLDIPTRPASESPFFGFNDTGGDAILLRNANGHLICRVVYTDATLSSSSTVTRFPDANGVFLPQHWVSNLPATPGRQFHGAPWSDPAPQLVSQHPITVSADEAGVVTLTWTATPGLFYTVWQTDRLDAPFTPRFYGLTFPDTNGRFQDTSSPNHTQRFYWISTP